MGLFFKVRITEKLFPGEGEKKKKGLWIPSKIALPLKIWFQRNGISRAVENLEVLQFSIRS